MISGTYSPSLNIPNRAFSKSDPRISISSTGNDMKEETKGITPLAAQLILMDACLLMTQNLRSSSNIIGAAAALPAEALSRSIVSSMGSVGSVLTLHGEAVADILARSMEPVRSSLLDTTPGTLVDGPPQIEHRGWKDYVDPNEYEARMNAISPRSANIETEDYAPPTPLGKVRTIHRG